MKKILIASLCVFALSITGAAAKPKHHAKKHQHTTTNGMSSQSAIPGNPYAGGGPAGSNQATNRPNASNEIGGGR